MRGGSFVIGADVGGTKTRVGAVGVLPEGGLGSEVLIFEQIPTPRTDPARFYDAVARLTRRVCAKVKQEGGTVLPVVAIAHPGRFLSDSALARGTTPNLGTHPNEFDGLRPAEELRQRLGGVVFVENDAIAQMRFSLDVLLRDGTIREQLLGQTVVYLGPGTGMGGGVARVGKSGQVSVITDGHLFDLQVAGYADGGLTAEELFTGPAIARLAAEAGLEPATPECVSRLLADDHPAAHRIADLQGEILTSLIETIHSGHIVKIRLETASDGRILRHADEPDRAWPQADKEAVRGTSRFILAGSVGVSIIGLRIRAYALKRLQARGLADIQIFISPVDSADAGLLGVVRAIPPESLCLGR